MGSVPQSRLWELHCEAGAAHIKKFTEEELAKALARQPKAPKVESDLGRSATNPLPPGKRPRSSSDSSSVSFYLHFYLKGGSPC